MVEGPLQEVGWLSRMNLNTVLVDNDMESLEPAVIGDTALLCLAGSPIQLGSVATGSNMDRWSGTYATAQRRYTPCDG